MGVLIALLLGGFAQDNLGAILAGQPAANVLQEDGFYGAVYTTILSSYRYDSYPILLKPEFSINLGKVSIAAGYQLSIPSRFLTGIPVTLQASMNGIQIVERIYLRPRVSVFGPAHYQAADPYESYKTVVSGGGGADLIFAPLPEARFRPVFSLGGTAGYMYGTLINDISDYEESLEGLGGAGNASASILYHDRDEKWKALLELKASYGGRLVPEASLLFLW